MRGGGEKCFAEKCNGRPPLLGLKEGDVSLSASTIHNISPFALLHRNASPRSNGLLLRVVLRRA